MKCSLRIAAFGVLLTALGCGQQPPQSGLRGAGATFVEPLMVQWTHTYEAKEDGCKVEYRSLGSTAGVKFMIEKEADFGCTDCPMTDEQLADARKHGGEVLHIPLVLGAVVPVYNLPDVKETLRFTGPVLARIYMGKGYPGKEEDKILRWNHPELRAINPGVELPDKEIRVVHRRDGSGTTGIWTNYLSKASSEWQKTVGSGQEVKWPAGAAEVGNEGVAEHVKKTVGSIGYVDLAHAHQMDLSIGLVQNRSNEKQFVKANLASITAAAENCLDKFPDNLRYMIDDAPGEGAYPISGITFAIVYVNQPAGKGKELAGFLRWALGEGQGQVGRLFYAPLPEQLAARAVKKLDQIQSAQ
jgi:phosphate transport system substrate-binding protein